MELLFIGFRQDKDFSIRYIVLDKCFNAHYSVIVEMIISSYGSCESLAKAAGVRRSRKGNLWQSIFFGLLFLLTAYVLARSQFFEVREIRVAGNDTLGREEIISVAGINPGENIFKLDLRKASEKLKVIPVVKSVEMYRRLPSAVEIKIQERKPAALLPVGGGFIQVDGDGVYIRKGSAGMDQLPVVTGVTAFVPVVGQKVESEALATALEVIKGLPAALIIRLSEINISEDQVVAYTLDGIQCRLGTVSDLGQKGDVFMKVLDELKVKGKRIEYIDLSYAGSPVVKYME